MVPVPPVFSMEEIDQLMAPIALYPADLLVQHVGRVRRRNPPLRCG